MTRTMIDIFRKGNKELFHSSMIAWLLDPKAEEHRLGGRFLEGFADKLTSADRGSPKLKEAVEVSPNGPVRTEAPFLKSRYDMEIRIGDALVVVENKTKRVGETPQLDRYNSGSQWCCTTGSLRPISYTRMRVLEVREDGINAKLVWKMLLFRFRGFVTTTP